MGWKVAITIAGLDSGGGAGIHADIKAFAAMGVHGTTALTCVTAQNTLGVKRAVCLEPDMVRDQIEVVYEDMGIDAGKTGMLGNRDIVEEVARTVRKLGFPLVVDPVMIAKSGAPLLEPSAVDALERSLLPVAKVITPNRMEAEKLAGIEVRSLEDAKSACEMLSRKYGVDVVVVKGGHIEGPESVDVVYANGTFHELRAPRLNPRATHGTGCSFSAAIAAGLAKGLEPLDAIKAAKSLVTEAIKRGIPLGKGHWPVNPISWIEVPAERYKAAELVKRAVEMLEANGELVNKLIPEVQSNLAYAVDPKYAESREDVVGIPGRIVRIGNRVRASSCPSPSGSDHLARKILAVLKYDESKRAAMNIRYGDDVVDALKRLGLKYAVVDRRREPQEVKMVEGGTMKWIIDEAYRICGGIPDAIVDLGDWGKEPLVTILGRDPIEVVNRVLEIARTISR